MSRLKFLRRRGTSDPTALNPVDGTSQADEQENGSSSTLIASRSVTELERQGIHATSPRQEESGQEKDQGDDNGDTSSRRQIGLKSFGRALKKIVIRGDRGDVSTASSTPPSDAEASPTNSPRSPALGKVRKAFRRFSTGGSFPALSALSPRVGSTDVELSPQNSARNDPVIVQGFDDFDNHNIDSPRNPYVFKPDVSLHMNAAKNSSATSRRYHNGHSSIGVLSVSEIDSSLDKDAGLSPRKGLSPRGEDVTSATSPVNEEGFFDMGMNASLSAMSMMEDMFVYVDSFIGYSDVIGSSKTTENESGDLDTFRMFRHVSSVGNMKSDSVISDSVTDLLLKVQSSESLKGLVEAGATLPRADEHTESTVNAFTVCPADMFKLRIGPNYKWNKLKGPSPQCFYDIASVDIYTTEHYDKYVCSRMRFPAEWTCIDTHHPLIPPLFCVSVHVPTKTQPIFGATTDGPGYIMIFTFKMTEETSRHLANMDTAPPGLQLFARYCIEAPEMDDDPKSIWKGRFKFIANCHNMKVG